MRQMAVKTISLPEKNVPAFDELYVISDLHLGGQPNFQIFDASKELESLIQHLKGSIAPTKKIALVINGDFVDFLAEAPSRYFDPAEAAEKLYNIATREPSFSRIFDALKGFVNTKNCFLIITLGNHDLELALPWVKHRLVEILSGGSDEARGRIFLEFEGAGFLCKIGNASVLCVHGNEVDEWNLTDHDKIRKIGRDIIQGRPVEDWVPNAGTQLVIDVMNEIKRNYPFVDLLKPEIPAVIPILLAIAPEHYKSISSIGPAMVKLFRDNIRYKGGFLGNEETRTEEQLFEKATQSKQSTEASPPMGWVMFHDERKISAQRMFLDTEDRIKTNVQPFSLIDPDLHGEYLGKMSALWKYISGEEISEVLREALEDLQKDRSFDPFSKDDTFIRLDEKIKGDIDFLIAGHTHLERALKRNKGKGWYFNSGTWIRLIKLEKEVLSDRENFAKVFRSLKDGSMSELDAHQGLVRRLLTVVVIKDTQKGTSGQLHHLNLGQGEDILAPVKGSLFIKKH